MFHPASWLAIYDGFDQMPNRIDPAVEGVPARDLDVSLRQMRAAIADAVARTPSHGAFLNQFASPKAA
jgi:tryptophan halogenase